MAIQFVITKSSNAGIPGCFTGGADKSQIGLNACSVEDVLKSLRPHDVGAPTFPSLFKRMQKFAAITHALSKGYRVEIRGFGSFSLN